MADREQLAIADGAPGRACWPATGPSWAPHARTTYGKLIFDLASVAQPRLAAPSAVVELVSAAPPSSSTPARPRHSPGPHRRIPSPPPHPTHPPSPTLPARPRRTASVELDMICCSRSAMFFRFFLQSLGCMLD